MAVARLYPFVKYPAGTCYIHFLFYNLPAVLEMNKWGTTMKIALLILLLLLAGCVRASEEELKAKVDACTAAGMNYTYLNDYRGNPYDVMCVAKRLR